MSRRMPLSAARLAIAAAAVALAVGGCTYDYLQHSDRVAYRAGDAVKANLEAETINPSKRSMYVTSGLGRNGQVLADSPPVQSTPAATSANP